MTNGGIFIVINSSITDCIKFRTNPSYPSESAMCRIGVKLMCTGFTVAMFECQLVFGASSMHCLTCQQQSLQTFVF